jgi:hypothetical protein
VAGQVHRRADALDQAANVGHQLAERVGILTLRAVGSAVATQVGGDGAVAGAGQRLQLGQPGLGALREAMQEEDGRAGCRTRRQRPKPKAVGIQPELFGHLSNL